jgi:hypothetical protein
MKETRVAPVHLTNEKAPAGAAAVKLRKERNKARGRSQADK